MAAMNGRATFGNSCYMWKRTEVL